MKPEIVGGGKLLVAAAANVQILRVTFGISIVASIGALRKKIASI